MAAKKQTRIKTKLRKGDMVMVIAGKDKGKVGKIISVDRKRGRVVVEGVNLIKKHLRPNPTQGIKGGIVEQEAPIHISNVMAVTSDGRPTRIGIRIERVGGEIRRVRIAKRTGEPLDRTTS